MRAKTARSRFSLAAFWRRSRPAFAQTDSAAAGQPRSSAGRCQGAGAAAVGLRHRRADAHGMLGRDVRSAADENMGRIVDVIVDRAGQVRAAVIDFGGFLGVGSRKIVVDWNALHFQRISNKKRRHHAGTDQGAGDGGA